MGNEHGEWIMRGVSENDPCCIKSAEQLIDVVNEIGFLPLFANELRGFSVEEKTVSRYWWTDHTRDPWRWRKILAASGKVVYGKFFGKRAGFISLEWLPYFANFRRDGYDFDARWEDEKAKFRSKRVMDVLPVGEKRFSYQLKQQAGFGKGGEKNFEGIVTELQMQTYLCVCDFQRRTNLRGEPYGWPVALYTMPETLWGYDAVTAAYSEPPEQSAQRIVGRLHDFAPDEDEATLRKWIK